MESLEKEAKRKHKILSLKIIFAFKKKKQKTHKILQNNNFFSESFEFLFFLMFSFHFRKRENVKHLKFTVTTLWITFTCISEYRRNQIIDKSNDSCCVYSSVLPLDVSPFNVTLSQRMLPIFECAAGFLFGNLNASSAVRRLHPSESRFKAMHTRSPYVEPKLNGMDCENCYECVCVIKVNNVIRIFFNILFYACRFRINENVDGVIESDFILFCGGDTLILCVWWWSMVQVQRAMNFKNVARKLSQCVRCDSESKVSAFIFMVSFLFENNESNIQDKTV